MAPQVAKPPWGYRETNRNEKERSAIGEWVWVVKSRIRRYVKRLRRTVGANEVAQATVNRVERV